MNFGHSDIPAFDFSLAQYFFSHVSLIISIAYCDEKCFGINFSSIPASQKTHQENIHLPSGKEVRKLRAGFLMLLTAALCSGLVGIALASDTDNHLVTVQVNAINEVAIAGGSITLTINSTAAGQEPDDAVDNTTCDLAWTTNESSKKITVATDNGAQNFTLKVLAQNVTGGTAAAEVTLSTTAEDFVTGIATTTGGCDLRYTASATAAQGTGSDVHTVTYTLTAAK